MIEINSEMDLEVADALDATKFESLIEEIVWNKDITYLEAVLHFCEDKGIDVLDITKIISRQLKEKIEVDAIGEGLLPKRAVLPF